MNAGIKYAPAQAWYVRLWRKFFPLKGVNIIQENVERAKYTGEIITVKQDGYVTHYYPDGSTETHVACGTCVCDINWILKN